MNICLALSMEKAIGSNKTISTFKIVFSSAMLDNLTSVLLETILIADYLSMAICFKEAICGEKACHICSILLLDPKAFKMEVSFRSPGLIFFSFWIINTMEMEFCLFTCLCSIKFC